MGKIPDFNNANFLHELRYWLIRKIAGKCVVMLNCKLQIIDQQTAAPVILDNINGGLFENVSFPTQDGQILKVVQNG